MTTETITIKNLLHNSCYQLGLDACHRGNGAFMRGWESGRKHKCVEAIREILHWHPQLKWEAARWIKMGIHGAKG